MRVRRPFLSTAEMDPCGPATVLILECSAEKINAEQPKRTLPRTPSYPVNRASSGVAPIETPFDPTPPENQVALVEGDDLTRSNGRLRVVEPDLSPTTRPCLDGRRHSPMPGANLGQARCRGYWDWPLPVHARGFKARLLERASGSDGDSSRHGIDLDDVPRNAGGRNA